MTLLRVLSKLCGVIRTVRQQQCPVGYLNGRIVTFASPRVRQRQLSSTIEEPS